MDRRSSDRLLDCDVAARNEWINHVSMRTSDVVADSMRTVSPEILLQHAYPELRRYLSDPCSDTRKDWNSSCDWEYQPSNLIPNGEVLGNDYRIVRWIDDGGTASVYEVVQTTSSQHHAMKVFDLQGGADERDVVSETTITSRLHHEHIVKAVSVFSDRRYVGMCMELLEHSLLSISDRFQGHYQEIAMLLLQLANAVGYCHGEGIIHRDIGPHNILFTGRSPRIVDFGLAVDADEPAREFFATGVGTLGYASPEQVSGDVVDHRTDVYALGATLYQLLTGICRFQAITWETAPLVLNNLDPTPPRLFDRWIPEELNEICLRCLEIERDHRFENALELGRGLESFLHNRVDHR